MEDLYYKVVTQHINYKRIFLLSDVHIGVRANSLEWISNIKNYFQKFYIPFLKANVQNGDILFFLGDFFDSRQLLDIYVMNSSIDIVVELSEILPVYFMTGNHDIYKKYDTDVNSIAAFRYIPNVNVIEKPIVISNGESNILVLPWIGSVETEEAYVRANKTEYIFAHTEITGFKYDNGKDIRNSIDFMKFKGIKKIFSGHIHKRQEMQNIIYLGSPYHTKRSDIGNTKGIYLFNPSDNSFEFTLNDFSPIFQRIIMEAIMELTLEETSKLLNNNYTDIIVPDKFMHLFNLTKFIDILKDCKYKKIETANERKKFDDDLSNVLEGIDIRDILTLLEMSVDDLGHQMEVLVKLKLLNKKYYERASKESID